MTETASHFKSSVVKNVWVRK